MRYQIDPDLLLNLVLRFVEESPNPVTHQEILDSVARLTRSIQASADTILDRAKVVTNADWMVLGILAGLTAVQDFVSDTVRLQMEQYSTPAMAGVATLERLQEAVVIYASAAFPSFGMPVHVDTAIYLQMPVEGGSDDAPA